MNAKELASKINGREIGDEITPAEERLAKDAGLVVLFGASDDLAEFRGAISDEIGCYDGGDLFITPNGPLEEHEDRCECKWCGYEAAKSKAKKIEALWNKEKGYSWTYKIDLPHETFEIVEDGKPYCRGIVFSIEDLK